ncbi:hypothetical protein BUALT_Bualt19G0120000 [Buddleja alternifolia]|uniref:Pentatricopeptide repeat-containing protein n=1 Tax=Buddleja alternifolia TaxID=168488 RepID=A0AAV6W3C8_9LAMI|nr:hypothetical protein BUALT_Bualt19G0120000 [Buddleja alternifolia]
MDEEVDLVTVIHWISTCGKVGALEVGKLIDNYTISNELKSNVTVCNALLDMYPKCGSTGEVQKLFSTMNVKNVVSWATMISVFALNGKFKLHCRGKLKEALKFIQEMPLQPDAEPKAAAPYVEMPNIYASARDWNGVADMHVEMKSKGVVKWPGQSVTVVDGKCCMFTVEDRCRWEGFRVFETLDSLVLQLKDEMDSFDLEEVML